MCASKIRFYWPSYTTGNTPIQCICSFPVVDEFQSKRQDTSGHQEYPSVHLHSSDTTIYILGSIFIWAPTQILLTQDGSMN